MGYDPLPWEANLKKIIQFIKMKDNNNNDNDNDNDDDDNNDDDNYSFI